MGKVFERETKEDRELLGIQQNIGKWEKRKDGIGKQVGNGDGMGEENIK